MQRLFTQLRIIFRQKYDIRTYGTTNEASGNITRNTAEQHNLGIDQIGAKSYEAQNPQLYMVQQHEIYQTETFKKIVAKSSYFKLQAHRQRRLQINDLQATVSNYLCNT